MNVFFFGNNSMNPITLCLQIQSIMNKQLGNWYGDNWLYISNTEKKKKSNHVL